MTISTGSIPADPTWCSWCAAEKAPCEHHRGKDGKPKEYGGPDVFRPGDWIKSVIGTRYRACRWDKGGDGMVVFICTGYDPRAGFWMQDENDPSYRTNVSERAIDRTFHKVR